LQLGTGNPAWREFFWLTLAEVMLALLALYVPVLQLVATLLFPLPVALMVRRHHLAIALWTLFVVIIVALLVFGNTFAVLSFVLQAGVIGIVMGLLFKNSVSSGRSLKILVILSIVIVLLMLVFAYMVNGTNPFDIDKKIFGDLDQINQWYQDTGVLSAEEEQLVRQQIQSAIDLMISLIPGSLLIWAVIQTFVSYLLARKIFYRLGYKVQAMRTFTEWQYPWYVIWGLITGLVLLLAGDEWNLISLSDVGKNFLYVMSFFIMVLGISVFTHFIKKWKISGFIKGIIIFIVFLYWPLGIGLILILGLLDPVLNLRQLNK